MSRLKMLLSKDLQNSIERVSCLSHEDRVDILYYFQIAKNLVIKKYTGIDLIPDKYLLSREELANVQIHKFIESLQHYESTKKDHESGALKGQGRIIYLKDITCLHCHLYLHLPEQDTCSKCIYSINDDKCVYGLDNTWYNANIELNKLDKKDLTSFIGEWHVLLIELVLLLDEDLKI